jgi:hypothetical protein
MQGFCPSLHPRVLCAVNGLARRWRLRHGTWLLKSAVMCSCSNFQARSTARQCPIATIVWV